MRYINCFKCNNNGNTPNACICDEASESPSTPCSDADLRRAMILGAFARAKGYKVRDNPYSEDDNRHWKWMQGWAESGDLQL